MTTDYSVPTKGFFKSLFDFSFTSFITPKIIRIVFGIVIVLVGLAALIYVIVAFRANLVLGIVTLLILAPLGFLFYVIWTRIVLEVVMAIFTIADSTRALAMQGGALTPPGYLGPQAQWGPPQSSQRAPSDWNQGAATPATPTQSPIEPGKGQSTETPTQAPAGWYPDSTGEQRFWDGAKWTEQTQSPG